MIAILCLLLGADEVPRLSSLESLGRDEHVSAKANVEIASQCFKNILSY